MAEDVIYVDMLLPNTTGEIIASTVTNPRGNPFNRTPETKYREQISFMQIARVCVWTWAGCGDANASAYLVSLREMKFLDVFDRRMQYQYLLFH